MSEPSYSICLRRSSQMEALSELSESVRSRVFAIGEMPRARHVKPKATKDGEVAKSQPISATKQLTDYADCISRSCNGNESPIFLDLWTNLRDPKVSAVGIFDPLVRLRLTKTEWTLLLPWNPLVTAKELKAAQKFVAHRDIGLRFDVNDQRWGDLKPMIDDRRKALGVGPERTVLVIDCGRIPDDLDMRKLTIAKVAKAVKSLDQLKSIVVIAGSGPISVSGFDQDLVTPQTRREGAFFDSLQKECKGSRQPIAGDFGTLAPEALGGGGRGVPMTPAIRYTTRGAWLVSKGHPAKPGTAPTPADYVAPTERITVLEDFRPSASRGEEFYTRVAERSANDVNAAAFVREATVSHITFASTEAVDRRKAS